MAPEQPIACTLTGDDLPRRLALMGEVGAALTSAAVSERRAVLTFRPERDTTERLEAIIAAESECCAFLRFSVDIEADGSILTINAPEGAEAVMRELVGAFRGTHKPV